MPRRTPALSKTLLLVPAAVLGGLQVRCSAEYEVLSTASGVGGAPFAAGGSVSAGTASMTGGSFGAGAGATGATGGELSGGGGAGGGVGGAAAGGTSGQAGVTATGGASAQTGGANGGGSGGAVATGGSAGETSAGSGNVAGTTAGGGGVAGTGVGGASQCAGVYECSLGSVCDEGSCVVCEPQSAQCPERCPLGSTKMVLERNGCTVCECLPPSECETNMDCPAGEICYPGAQCEEGCSELSCCYGNQCSAPGCTTFTAPCSVVGCEGGAHCDPACALYACECVDGSVVCEETAVATGGAAGMAGTAGTYSACGCGSP